MLDSLLKPWGFRLGNSFLSFRVFVLDHARAPGWSGLSAVGGVVGVGGVAVGGEWG